MALPQANALTLNEYMAWEALLATKTDLVELKYDILKWVIGLALAQAGLLIGILIKIS